METVQYIIILIICRKTIDNILVQVYDIYCNKGTAGKEIENGAR